MIKVLIHGFYDKASGREHVESYLEQFSIQVAKDAEHAFIQDSSSCTLR